MKPKQLCSVLAAVILGGILLSPTAHAQYTGDFQTNIISGVEVDWTGTYAVGSNTAYDFLGIDSGGALISDAGGIGVTGGGVGNDAVSVSGTGSVWSNRNDLTIGYGFIDGQRSQNNNNSLTISDGGAVYDNNSFVGGHNNAVVVMGNGSAWNNSGTVIVGVDYFEGGHSLIIADGGVMSDDTAVFAGGSGSKALVVGPGSVWSNRNDLTLGGEGGHSLVISNGGAVYDVNGEVGGFNKVLVTGIGSVWSNSNSLVVGYQNSVIISNGGALYSASGDLNDNPGHMLVTGVGSVWRIGGSLEVAGDQNLTIADEGVVSAGSVSNKAFITVSGGGLYVTNGLGTGALTLYGGGRLTLNSGTVNVDSLASGQGSTIGFNGSTLRTKATTIDNGSTFTVGDGASSAMLKLDSGGSGFHSFANGLTISSNATLRGNGTIIGSTVVNGGGVLAPGASPGSITFSNSLTLAPNSTFAVELNGPTDGQYDRIVTLGTVSVSNSVLSLSLGFAPSVGDTFTIISNLGPSAVFGVFVDPQGNVLLDNAIFVVNDTTFEISYTGNVDGQDVILTAVIPEPATWLLTAFGIVAPVRLLAGFRFRVGRGTAIVAAGESSRTYETGSSILDWVVDGGGGHRCGRIVLHAGFPASSEQRVVRREFGTGGQGRTGPLAGTGECPAQRGSAAPEGDGDHLEEQPGRALGG